MTLIIWWSEIQNQINTNNRFYMSVETSASSFPWPIFLRRKNWVKYLNAKFSLSHSVSVSETFSLPLTKRAVWQDWPFFKLLCNKFSYKISQNILVFFGLFQNNTTFMYKWFGYFLGNIRQYWATFYSIIWSHWKRVKVYFSASLLPSYKFAWIGRYTLR